MTSRLRALLALAAFFVTILAPAPALAQVTDRLDAAAVAFEEIMRSRDSGIPEDLLRKAACLVIVPGVKKGAFIVGGQYGRGFMACRRDVGWSAPAAVRIEGGSVGFQIGGSDTDLFMLVMNERGADKLLSTKFTLGADAAVAAGPVGRQTTAQTDAAMRAEILSWSRSRGVFAGIALQGATLREDDEANRDLYGKGVSNRAIVRGTIEPPRQADQLMRQLRRF